MAIKRGDLVGTKNGTNDAFTIPWVPIANSERITLNGLTLDVVGSFTVGAARYGECIISGQNVQIGLPPNVNDKLKYFCDVA